MARKCGILRGRLRDRFSCLVGLLPRRNRFGHIGALVRRGPVPCPGAAGVWFAENPAALAHSFPARTADAAMGRGKFFLGLSSWHLEFFFVLHGTLRRSGIYIFVSQGVNFSDIEKWQIISDDSFSNGFGYLFERGDFFNTVQRYR